MQSQDFALNQVTTHAILRTTQYAGQLLPVSDRPSTLTLDYVVIGGKEYEVPTKDVLAYVGTNQGFTANDTPYEGWLYLLKSQRTRVATTLVQAQQLALSLVQKYFE